MEYKTNTELGHFLLDGMQSIRIEPNKNGGHSLFIDGTEIKHVRSFRLEMGVDQLTTLEIQMRVGCVNVETKESVQPEGDQNV